MTKPTFSPAIIKAVVDAITGGPGNSTTPAIGIYRTGPKIEALMADCGLDFRVGASRLPSLTNYLRHLVDTDPLAGEKIARVIMRVAEPDDYDAHDPPGRQQAVVAHLNRFLAREGMEIVLLRDRPQLTVLGRSGVVVGAIAAKVATIDFDTVQRDIGRALASAHEDPEDALTAACSIVESVCRSILSELKLPLPAKRDIDGLMRAVQEPLGLSPTRTDLPPEIASDVRQVLSGMTTVVKGVGALRTHAGDAHGRERGFRRIDARIARLAVHAASTMALFLIETWERKERRPLPHADQDGSA
jgi:Abortive infection C-terminus